MDWLSVVPLVIAAVGVLFGGGLLVTSAARLPVLALVASAPAVATSVVGLTAVVCGIAGVGFGPLAAAVGFVVSAALAWGIRVLMDRIERRGAPARSAASVVEADAAGPAPLTAGPGWLVWIAWAGAFVLMVRHWRAILGSPEAFSQTYDNIFHMNAVRWILETGQGSSIAFPMTSADPGGMYYPTGWHDLVALVAMIVPGGDVALAVNAVTLVVMGLVWTIGCLFLVRSLTNGNPAVMLGTGVLSASFAAFPFLLLGFGVLYPNFLGLCLLPAGLALTVHVLRIQSGPPVHLASAVLVGILVLGGAAIAHPNVLMSYLVVLLPMLAASVWAAVPGRREPGGARRLWTCAVLLALAVPATLAAWIKVRPPADASIWMPYLSSPEAVGAGILFAAGRLWPAWPLAFLAVLGAYAAFRWARHRWLVLAHGVLIGLWVVASAMQAGELRSFLVGVWYNDSYRLASLLPITGLPLAALGLEHLARLIKRWLAPVTRGWSVAAEYVVAVVLTAALLVSTQTSTWMNRAIDSFHESFALATESPLVSPDEYAVIEDAERLVPRGAVIATNPWNGSSMVFAIAGRASTTTHVAYELTPDLDTIKARLDEAASDPRVCEAVRNLGVRYVLDFGPKEVHGGDHEYTGFDRLEGTPGFELLSRHGDAALFEVTACR